MAESIALFIIIFGFLLWVGRPAHKPMPAKNNEPIPVDRYGLDRECGLSKDLRELDRLRANEQRPELFFMAVSKIAVRDEVRRCFVVYDRDIDSLPSCKEREALKEALGITRQRAGEGEG